MNPIATDEKPETMPAQEAGYVDFYGQHGAAGGWLVCAWVSNAVAPNPRGAQDGFTLEMRFENGESTGEGLAAYFHRDDLAGRGVGVIFFLASADRYQGRLLALVLRNGTGRHVIPATTGALQLRETDIVARLRPIFGGAFASDSRTELLGLISRRGYVGENTLL